MGQPRKFKSDREIFQNEIFLAWNKLIHNLHRRMWYRRLVIIGLKLHIALLPQYSGQAPTPRHM